LTLAIAEGVTGGQVGAMLDRAHWQRRSFLGGIIAHGQPGEVLAGLPETTRMAHGSRSSAAAIAMAHGVRLLMGADLGLATTGIARAEEAGPGQEPGQVWIALAWEGGEAVFEHHWFASPGEVRSRTAKKAINQLRLHLLEHLT
jgi:PncC family amidohydrolase